MSEAQVNILFRLCKLALSSGSVEWALESFTEDPQLDEIRPGLLKCITTGRKVHIPGVCTTISIHDMKNVDTVIFHCVTDLVGRTIKNTQIPMTLAQTEKFLNYVESHGIDIC